MNVKKFLGNKLVILTILGLAMGWWEGVVVVYIREIIGLYATDLTGAVVDQVVRPLLVTGEAGYSLLLVEAPDVPDEESKVHDLPQGDQHRQVLPGGMRQIDPRAALAADLTQCLPRQGSLGHRRRQCQRAGQIEVGHRCTRPHRPPLE